MSACTASNDVQAWFINHGLPFKNATKATLNDQGVESVDDLKFLDRKIVNDLFEHDKPIVKAKAKAAWEELGGSTGVLSDKIAVAHPVDIEATKQPTAPALEELSGPVGILSCKIAVAQPDNIEASEQYNEISDHEQPTDELVLLNISPLAIASIVVFGFAFFFGIMCIAFTAESYYDYDYGAASHGTGFMVLLLFATATPLSFCAGRGYLNQKRQHQPNFMTENNENCCACPGGIAIGGWVLFGIGVLNAIVLLIIGFGVDYVPVGAVVGVVIWSVIAWGLMFAYSEMIRKASL